MLRYSLITDKLAFVLCSKVNKYFAFLAAPILSDKLIDLFLLFFLRRPILKALKQDEPEVSNKVKDEEDNWDFVDVDLPYT